MAACAGAPDCRNARKKHSLCARCAEEKYGRYFDETARGSANKNFYCDAKVCGENTKYVGYNGDKEHRTRATRRAKKQQMRAKCDKKNI